MCINKQARILEGWSVALDASDATLIKVYKKNKHQGLEILYERYKKYVYTIAYHYAGNKEDALDLTQEVFVSIYKSLDSFKEEFSLLPWVKKITVNKCLNFIRDRKEALSLNQAIEDGNEIQDLIHSPDNTESKTLYRDTKQALEDAIKNLPKEERMAIVLRHMKGMKYEEIAKIMDVPLGTVKTYLHRGRKTIKACMIKDGIWEG
ncbi:RNA polymerase sigma factor [Desulfitobacterium sp. Sab5]|uniref:RNA polymerase sigma factor n=1 Tax=Desulfitobacterium nosdiversum TaxID=3375356 RepID=UPI003CF39CD5